MAGDVQTSNYRNIIINENNNSTFSAGRATGGRREVIQEERTQKVFLE
jgi:predicted RNA-binding protein with PUA domain